MAPWRQPSEILEPGTAINHNQVASGSTAAVLLAANPQRRRVTFTNIGAAAVFLGKDASVTTLNGHALPAGASQAFNSGAAFFVISAAAQTVTFLEEVA